LVPTKSWLLTTILQRRPRGCQLAFFDLSLISSFSTIPDLPPNAFSPCASPFFSSSPRRRGSTLHHQPRALLLDSRLRGNDARGSCDDAFRERRSRKQAATHGMGNSSRVKVGMSELSLQCQWCGADRLPDGRRGSPMRILLHCGDNYGDSATRNPTPLLT